MRAPPVRAPHLLAGSLCVGLAASLAVRMGASATVAAGCLLVRAPFLRGGRRLGAIILGLALLGAWWGSGRLDALDRSVLAPTSVRPGSRRSRSPARRGPGGSPSACRCGSGASTGSRSPSPLGWSFHSAVPRRRAPSWRSSRRSTRHDVPRPTAASTRPSIWAARACTSSCGPGSYRQIGERGGVRGVVDGLRRLLAASMAPGLDGERRAVIGGIVLGEDEQLSESLRDDFKASGLYHLLAVSGQNVAYVIGGILLVGWVAGVPRRLAVLAAVAGVAGYTGAVGWQPSVVRAGVAGGARVSRVARVAPGRPVVLPARRRCRASRGQPVHPARARGSSSRSSRSRRSSSSSRGSSAGSRATRCGRRSPNASRSSIACGLVTAPVLWLHFGAIPVYTVLANALAAPVVPLLLGFALVCAVLDPLPPSAAFALAWVNGWLAAYLAWCAGFVADLPHARLTSRGALAVALVVGAAAFLATRLRPPRAQRIAALALMVVASSPAGACGSAATVLQRPRRPVSA